MAQFVFWFAFALVIYVIIGYPVFMFIWASFQTRRVRKSFAYQPTVSIVLPCFNEAKRIEAKLLNLAALRYDLKKLELVIVSDGSTDNTADIINKFSAPFPVRVITLPERQGKPAALNAGVAAATGEIVLFSDTRQFFNRNALRKLITNLADPEVGAVSGTLIDYFQQKQPVAPEITKAKKLFALFRDYENLLKEKESMVHSLVGVYGSLYALRRKLFKPLPPQLILDDMFIPFQVIFQGFRVVFDKGAVAYEQVKDDPEIELQRRNRIFLGTIQFVLQNPKLLNPALNPILLQYIGHKVIRIVFPLLFAAIFIANMYLLDRVFYLLFFIAQDLFYLTCFISLLNPKKKSVFYLFSKYNTTMLRGFWNYFTGNYTIKWQKH